jgi:hypothetical protein
MADHFAVPDGGECYVRELSEQMIDLATSRVAGELDA